ncbi:MAG: TonB-dependent receptor [Saprospiraceae bacterium]
MKYFYFRLCISLSFSLMAVVSMAQDALLTGKITDKSSGEGLIGAYVIIEGTSHHAVTDIDGNYTIAAVSPGTYSINISYIGYDDLVNEVTLKAGEKLKKSFKLGFSGIQLGTVEVTAQMKGQMSSINDQLNSNMIKNVVSAERIQELPDANVAETMSRLPGVSVQRVGGEGNKVVVRGLAPKYTKVMIEGVSVAASGSDRSTDISIISPYALDGIELMKAITADQDANFVGGSINFKLRTAKPGLNGSVIAQGGYNGLSGNVSDYLLVGNVSNRFLSDKIGLYLQSNIENRNRSSNDQGATYDVRELSTDSREIHTTSLSLSDAYRAVERQGATLVLDYNYGDGTVFFKNFYSRGVTKIDRYNEFFDLRNSNRLHNYETRKEQYDTETLSNILSWEHRIGKWSIESKLSNSTSKRDVPVNFGFMFQQKNAIASEVLNATLPPTDLLGYTSINDTITFLETINESTAITNEKQQAFTLDLKYDYSISENITGFLKFGGKYKHKNRSFDKTQYTGRFRLNSGQVAKDAILKAYPDMQLLAPLGTTSLPFAAFIDSDFDHGDFLNGEYNLGAVADVDLLENVIDIIKNNVKQDEFQTYSRHDYRSVREDYNGSEDLYAGYLMTELNFGQKIKFIPGIRYENNNTSYTAPNGDATKTAFPDQNYLYNDTTVNRSNSFVLPMIHLKYKPLPWFDIRLAYTHTLSRPSYFQFTPRTDILSEVVIKNNAELQPEFSKNIDVYMSFKSNKLGLLTVGGFQKDIENMIFSLDRRVILDPVEYQLPEETLNSVIFTQDNNTFDASVRGVEVDWQTSLWYLPGMWSGIILNINYTHIFSQVKYPRTVIEFGPIDPVTFMRDLLNVDSYLEDRLLLQPDDIINFQIGYDYKDFSARVSTLYQSSVFKGSSFYDELVRFSKSYNRWDISLKQKLPYYGMQVFVNLNNISNSGDRDIIKGAPWDTRIQRYGRTIDLGIRADF